MSLSTVQKSMVSALSQFEDLVHRHSFCCKILESGSPYSTIRPFAAQRYGCFEYDGCRKRKFHTPTVDQSDPIVIRFQVGDSIEAVRICWRFSGPQELCEVHVIMPLMQDLNGLVVGRSPRAEKPIQKLEVNIRISDVRKFCEIVCIIVQSYWCI